MSWRGHLWTVLPHLGYRVFPPRVDSVDWSTALEDDKWGMLRLTGRLDEVAGATGIVVIVHGMGSHAEQSYVVLAAQRAREHGMSSLRVNLRGANVSGDDIYHAGLVEDLKAAIDSPEVRRYRDIHLLGFSLGGHMVMRYALHPDPQVRSAASVCAPTDLQASCRYVDRPQQLIYRNHLLRGLRRGAWAVEANRGTRIGRKPLKAIKSIREWDEKVVAPRFGFASASDYYEQISVGPHLSKLAIPVLIVYSEADPMVNSDDLMASLAKVGPHTKVRAIRRGGHVQFPRDSNPIGDAMRWLRRYRT